MLSRRADRWFEALFGFSEACYGGIGNNAGRVGEENREQFSLEDDPGLPVKAWRELGASKPTRLVSRANGASFQVGHFFTPSVSELRDAVERIQGGQGASHGATKLEHVAIGDVLLEHARHPGATFQAASQFNALEFASPRAVPENGVTGYYADHTQGPACALACAAGTVYRNYFAIVDDGPPPSGEAPRRGQTTETQINTLDDLSRAIGNADNDSMFTVSNGYTFTTRDKIETFASAVRDHPGGREDLVGRVRIAVQAGTEVTFSSRWSTPDDTGVTVTQCYCSAVSCAYSGIGCDLWAPLATIALDAAYEATLLTAFLDRAAGHGNGVVFLTLLGGGVFGNDMAWIGSAIARAAHRCRNLGLDVRVAHYRTVDSDLAEYCAKTLIALQGEGGTAKN